MFESKWQPRLGRWLAGCVLLAMPTLVLLLGLRWMGYRLKDFRPVGGNDETHYFLEIQGFADHGFDCGYFTVEEKPARGFFEHPFGPHGPIYPVTYGLLGRYLGLKYHSPILFHTGILTTALLAYILLVRPSTSQMLLLAALLGSFWPFHRDLFGLMQEPIHLAIALVLAGWFHRLVGEEPASRGVVVGLFVFLCVASLWRVSWALLFVPYFLLTQPGWRSWRRATLSVALGGAMMLGLLLLFSSMCAPYEISTKDGFISRLVKGQASPLVIFELLGTNLRELARLALVRTPMPHCLAALVAQLHLGLLLVCLVAGLAALWKPHWAIDRTRTFLVLGNLGLMTLAMLLLYRVDLWIGPRLFTPPLLLTLALLVASPARWPRAVALTVLLIQLGEFTWSRPRMDLRDFHASRFKNDPFIVAFDKAIHETIHFEEAPDRWHNTVLTNVYPPEWAAMPSGLGISCWFRGFEERMRLPARSRYVIGTAESVAPFAAQLDLVRHIPTRHGNLNLYRNRLSCASQTPTSSPASRATSSASGM